MYKNIFKIACIPLLFSMFVLPANVMASGKAHQNQMNPYHQSNLVHQYKVKKNHAYYYAPQDQQIAYLYAIIAQLQAQLAFLQANRPVTYPYTSGGNTSTREISRVVTGSVEADDSDSVSMEGKITFARDTKARVWFEYGASTNLPYSTESVEIDGDDGDTEDFELTATDLDDNKTYYYRAVAKDSSGSFAEGVIKSFRFDSRNNNDNDNDEDWSLELDDNRYETGDIVRVEYTVEDENNDNYIALFEVGDDDDDYISRIFINDEEGSVTFRINNEGEYEFRLFDEDEDVQAESDEFEVED